MDKIINAYTDNEDLIKALVDFIEMRRKKKKPLTERALILFLNRMDDMLETDELKIEELNDSVCNCWSIVYDKRIINYDNSKGKEMFSNSANPINRWGFLISYSPHCLICLVNLFADINQYVVFFCKNRKSNCNTN